MLYDEIKTLSKNKLQQTTINISKMSGLKNI